VVMVTRAASGRRAREVILLAPLVRWRLRSWKDGHESKIMKPVKFVVVTLCSVLSFHAARAGTDGSVEPFASDAVVDIGLLEAQSLDVRIAFAERLLRCGVVDQVEDLLSAEHVTRTISDRNTHFQIAAGGFAGGSNPTYAFTVVDSGANAASHQDIKLLTDSLGYVLSQDSAFLLDTDSTTTFDFPSNYVVLNFRHTPSIEQSAELFETVGRIDPELFETDTSGYTQFGRSYVSLQSDVPDAEFIAGYVQAAQEAGVEYTPIIGGVPSLFQGSAAFPGNDWVAHPRGEDYLGRLPHRIHGALGRIRDFHLSFTRKVLRKIRRGDADHRELLRFVNQLDCY
jgi:hypothetical protein